MKPLWSLLLVLLFPFAALAVEKDLAVGVNYKSFNTGCSVSAASTCLETLDSEDFLAQPKLIHSMTFRLLAQPGSTCELSLTSFHLVQPTAIDLLFTGYATEHSPVTLSVPFPQPLRLEDPDTLQLEVKELTGLGSGCLGEVIVGVELVGK